MQKIIYVALAVILLLAGCKSEPPATTGPALLTISGKIGVKNTGETFVVDQAYFDAKSVEVTLADPWMGESLTYQGILVRDLLKDLKVSKDAQTLRLVSSDGKGVNISISEAARWNILLARRSNGAELELDAGGPVKVVFPAEARGSYPDAAWIWWLSTAEVR